MFKKLITAALAAISFSAGAGNSTIIKLDDAQPIRYEAEHNYEIGRASCRERV